MWFGNLCIMVLDVWTSQPWIFNFFDLLDVSPLFLFLSSNVFISHLFFSGFSNFPFPISSHLPNPPTIPESFSQRGGALILHLNFMAAPRGGGWRR